MEAMEVNQITKSVPLMNFAASELHDRMNSTKNVAKKNRNNFNNKTMISH